MADVNEELTKQAELLQLINRDLAQFGFVTEETKQKLMDAKTGIDNFNKKLSAMGGTVVAVGDAFVSYNKSLLEGASANRAASVAMDKTAHAAEMAGAALALLIPGGAVIKAVVAGIGLLAGAALRNAKMISDQAETLYTGFQQMARAGANGAEGINGLFKDMQKLGLGLEKMGDYTRLIGESSRDLALFTGTVSSGKDIFVRSMAGLTKANREELELKVGGREAQAEVAMQYLRQQRQLTMGTKTQMDVSSAAVMRYVRETDELTRITGLNRQEQQKALDEAMSREQFAAAIAKIQREQGAEAAAAAKNYHAMMYAIDPKAGRQFADSLSGFIGASEDSTQATLATNGKINEISHRFMSGQIKTQKETVAAAQEMAEAYGQTAEMFEGSALMANLGSTMGSYQMMLKMQTAATNDLNKSYEKAAKDEQNRDKTTSDMAKNENAARNESLKLQADVNKALDAFVTGQGKLGEKNSELTEQMRKLGEVITEKVIPVLEKVAVMATNGLLKVLELLFSVPANKANQEVMPTKSAAASRENLDKLLATADANTLSAADENFAKLNYDATSAMLAKKYAKYGTQAGRAEAALAAEGKAAGGPVGKGTPYLVGEEGPELFVPSIAGDIVPLKNLAGSTGVAMRQSEKVEKLIRDITQDTIDIEKATDQDAKRAKEYSQFYKTYIEVKKTYEQKQMDLINYQMSETSGGGGGGGTGLRMPAMPGIAGMGGGQGLTKLGQNDLAAMGLQIRSADTQAAGAGISPALIELAKQVQAAVPGFAGFTAFNDKFHNERAPSSKHTKGLAMDFALANKPSIEDGRAITDWLRSMGASLAIDEYNNPSAGATGGHIHAEIPTFGDGGELAAGRVGIAGESGPELITGPASITPMNDLTRAIGSMTELMRMSVEKLDEINRAAQRTSDASDKMLAYAQN